MITPTPTPGSFIYRTNSAPDYIKVSKGTSERPTPLWRRIIGDKRNSLGSSPEERKRLQGAKEAFNRAQSKELPSQTNETTKDIKVLEKEEVQDGISIPVGESNLLIKKPKIKRTDSRRSLGEKQESKAKIFELPRDFEEKDPLDLDRGSLRRHLLKVQDGDDEVDSALVQLEENPFFIDGKKRKDLLLTFFTNDQTTNEFKTIFFDLVQALKKTSLSIPLTMQRYCVHKKEILKLDPQKKLACPFALDLICYVVDEKVENKKDKDKEKSLQAKYDNIIFGHRWYISTDNLLASICEIFPLLHTIEKLNILKLIFKMLEVLKLDKVNNSTEQIIQSLLNSSKDSKSIAIKETTNLISKLLQKLHEENKSEPSTANEKIRVRLSQMQQECGSVTFSSLESFLFKDKDIKLVAEEIVKLDLLYFTSISASEICLSEYNSQKFKEKNITPPANLKSYISYFEAVSYFVAAEILKCSEIKERANACTYFIKLAIQVVKLKNFNIASSILAGLDMAGVNRLKKTWELVKEKHIKQREELSKLLAPMHNYRDYRAKVAAKLNNFLPLFTVYLRDVTSIKEGNQDYDKDQFNINKLELFAKAQNDMYKLQQKLVAKVDLKFKSDLFFFFSNLSQKIEGKKEDMDKENWETSLRYEPSAQVKEEEIDFAKLVPAKPKLDEENTKSTNEDENELDTDIGIILSKLQEMLPKSNTISSENVFDVSKIQELISSLGELGGVKPSHVENKTENEFDTLSDILDTIFIQKLISEKTEDLDDAPIQILISNIKSKSVTESSSNKSEDFPTFETPL